MLLKKAFFKTLMNTTGILSISDDSISETVLTENEVLFYDYDIPNAIVPPWQPFIDEVEATLGHLEYINTKYGYGLNKPEDWIIDDYYNGEFELRFRIQDISRSNLSLSVRPPYRDIFSQEVKNLSSEVARLLDYYENNASENITLLSHSEKTINGMDAYEFVVSSQQYGNWKTKTVYVEKGDCLFKLEYKTLPEYYDTYISVVNESIDSFMMISPYYEIDI